MVKNINLCVSRAFSHRVANRNHQERRKLLRRIRKLRRKHLSRRILLMQQLIIIKRIRRNNNNQVDLPSLMNMMRVIQISVHQRKMLKVSAMTKIQNYVKNQMKMRNSVQHRRHVVQLD